MFGGNVVGKYLMLKPSTEILMEWRFRNWKEEDVSKVRIASIPLSCQACQLMWVGTASPYEHMSTKTAKLGHHCEACNRTLWGEM